VRRVGRAFGIWRAKGLEADVSRADGPFAEAAGRRDLRINSLGWDPLCDELLDPHGGLADLEAARLRATRPARFGDDPLRALRVARLAASLEMQPDAELSALCAAQDWSGAASERIYAELEALLRCRCPSVGWRFLERTGQLRHLPLVEALVGVPQDVAWHPEGDVWVHTRMVIDAAAALRTGEFERDARLMWSALCHDLGKPATTRREAGRVRSVAHDELGARLTREWLGRLHAPHARREAVAMLVAKHLAPSLFHAQGAGDGAVRRLARKLERAGVDLHDLVRLARADHLGRTTADARAGRFEAGDVLLARARRLEVTGRGLPSAVLGRHLQARGWAPGPEFGRVLARCRELQDETGWRDPQAILDRVLGDLAVRGDET
jgi:tRNA nucleotidyltransferase (CCA-adding enzyme)